jgi:hypothetical protein
MSGRVALVLKPVNHFNVHKDFSLKMPIGKANGIMMALIILYKSHFIVNPHILVLKLCFLNIGVSQPAVNMHMT